MTLDEQGRGARSLADTTPRLLAESPGLLARGTCRFSENRCAVRGLAIPAEFAALFQRGYGGVESELTGPLQAVEVRPTRRSVEMHSIGSHDRGLATFQLA